MALEAGQAYVDLVPRLDPAFAQKAAAQVEAATTPLLDRIGQRFDAFGEKLRGFGSRMTTFVTLPIAALGVATFKLASDLNESTSKAQVVFEDFFGQVDAVAKKAAKTMGLSRQEALESAGTFGNLFRALNIATPQAAEMSTTMLQLAADMGSFNNVPTADALEAIRSGLVGETEPLRRFGVNLNEARIKAKALELGLVNEKEELTGAAKAQAAYALILEDSTLQQGDYSRTADGAANRTKTLTAQAKDLAANLGTKLLPIGAKILGFVGKLFDGFDKLSPTMQNVIIILGLVAAALGPLIYIIGAVSTALGFLIANPIVLVLAAIAAAAYLLYRNWDEVFPEIKRIAQEVWAWLEEHAAFVVDAIRGIIAGVIWVKDHWREIWAEVQATAKEVWAWIEEHVGPVFESVARYLTVAMDRISEIVEGAITVILFLWDNFGATILEFLRGVWDGIVAVIEGALVVIGGIFDFFTAIFSGDWSAAWEAIKTILSGAWDVIVGIVDLAINTVKGILNAALDALGLLWDFAWGHISDALGGIWETIKSTVSSGVDGVIDFVRGIPDRILGLVGSIKDAALGAGRAIIDGISEGVSGAVGFVADIAGSVVNAIKSFVNRRIIDPINDALDIHISLGPFGSIDIDAPDIPHLHTGGLIPGRAGEEVLMYGLAGERVIPRDRAANAGDEGNVDNRVYNFHGYDPRDVQAELSWADFTQGTA